MAEKQCQSFSMRQDVITIKYDDVTEKITRVTCDNAKNLIIKIVEGATEWTHTFTPGSAQSEDVTETFPVTEDGEGRAVFNSLIGVSRG